MEHYRIRFLTDTQQQYANVLIWIKTHTKAFQWEESFVFRFIPVDSNFPTKNFPVQIVSCNKVR